MIFALYEVSKSDMHVFALCVCVCVCVCVLYKNNFTGTCASDFDEIMNKVRKAQWKIIYVGKKVDIQPRRLISKYNCPNLVKTRKKIKN